MDYFSLLHLRKEPFSNSPDPEMFFQSAQHQGCLQKLELAIRLRRGLSVVVGEIGTGKSTVCRQLLRSLADKKDSVRAHLILDPDFTSPHEFLLAVARTFGIETVETEPSEWRLKEAIKNYLFDTGVGKNFIPALIIDEGQKLPETCVEILREFLNYETNNHKLLQIIIFAQPEFEAQIKAKPNFADRITTYHHLGPLDYQDTRRMIKFRLHQAEEKPKQTSNYFSPSALLLIYLITGGYPRKIVMLCSKAIITMLVKNKKRVTPALVLAGVRETSLSLFSAHLAKAAFATGILMTLLVWLSWAMLPMATFKDNAKQEKLVVAAPPEPSAQGKNQQVAAELAPPEEQAQQEATDIEDERPLADENTAQTTATSSWQPRILGEIKVGPHDVLSKMIARVYGRYSTSRLTAVLEANPDINENNIRPGMKIAFPVLKVERPQFETGRYWIELDRFITLQEAYTLVRDYPGNHPPIIAPYLQSGQSTQFRVIIEESYKAASDARGALSSLPEKYRQTAAIRSESPEGESLF